MNKYTLVFLLGLLSLVQATIVANSLEYEDVTSAVCYSYLKGEDVYLVYPNQAASVVASKLSGEVFLVESDTRPVHVGLKSSITARGITPEVFTSEDSYKSNLELAKLSGAESFIIIDPAYSYNVVTLFAYAKRTNSFILFANAENTDSVKDFLDKNTVNSLFLFGNIDPEVQDAVKSLGISYDELNEGDKYENNIALLEKYYGLGGGAQVYFSDGNIIEESIIDASYPTVLISYTIPDETYKFLKNKRNNDEITIGVLIGNQYTSTMYNFKKNIEEDTGKEFSVIVKFAKVTPGPDGGEMGELDEYLLPTSDLKIELKQMIFNKNTNELEIIFENTGETLAYVKFTGNLSLNGEYLQSLGEEEFFEVDKGEEVGLRYKISDIQEGTLNTYLNVFYSSSKLAVEKGFIAEWEIARIDYEDLSDIEISTAEFDPSANILTMKIANNGDVPAYFKVEAVYSMPGELPTAIVDEKVYTVEPGTAYTAQMRGVVVGVEEYTGMNMTTKVTYGEREAFMEKETEKEVSILGAAEDMTMLYLLALIIIIVIIAAYLLLSKKKGKK